MGAISASDMVKRSSSQQGDSGLRVVLFSIFASSFVLISSLILQWVVYDDWLHRTGPLRIVGTAIAAGLTFIFVFGWLRAEARRRAQMIQRFETIAEMNDRIRNALQVIECTTFATNPDTAVHVREAVERIDNALRGMVEATEPPIPVAAKPPSSATTGAAAKRTSA
jgi:hypothetical protein